MLRIVVSERAKATDSQKQEDDSHVYIGVCPSDDHTHKEWSAALQANGVPPRCIAWGMGHDYLLVNNNTAQKTHKLAYKEDTYGSGTAVNICVQGGQVDFHVEQAGFLRLKASVKFTDATLRPFVAVRGQLYQCTITGEYMFP